MLNRRFCWQARCFGGFSHIATTPKIEPFRRKIAQARCFPSQVRLSLDFRRLGALPDAPGRSFWCPGATSGTLWALLRRSRDAPRRSRDAPGTASGRSWVPMAFQAGSIAPQTTHLDRLWTDFAVYFRCFSRVWLPPLLAKPFHLGDRLGRIARAASPRPHRPGRIALVASPWPNRPGRTALTASPWPYRPGRIGIELPCERARYRASLPRSAHHRARSIWPSIELPCRARLTNDTISKKKRLTNRRACIAKPATISLHRLGHASSLVLLKSNDVECQDWP